MRKFVLFNADKTANISLSSNGILAVNPKGLGNKFNVSYVQNEKSRYKTNVRPDFDNIQLDLYFNADGSTGYKNYNRLAQFINKCGLNNMIFEYDDGQLKKYCRVLLNNLPKSEKDESGSFVSTIVLERQSYWYKEDKVEFSLESIIEDNAVSFTLPFPFGFVGDSFRKEAVFTNDFFEESPIEISISGDIKECIKIEVLDADDEVEQYLQLKTNCHEGRIIKISSIDNKKVQIIEGGVSTNAYDLIDKQGQSFLYIKPGTHKLRANIQSTDNGSISVSVLNYVLD